METKNVVTTAEVAMKIQEIQAKYDLQKTHLVSIFDDQVAKIEADYRKQRDELSAELLKFKSNQRKQLTELQETYMKKRREMLHRKHEAQTKLESARQKECLKVRLEESQQAALLGESDVTKTERM